MMVSLCISIMPWRLTIKILTANCVSKWKNGIAIYTKPSQTTKFCYEAAVIIMVQLESKFTDFPSAFSIAIGSKIIFLHFEGQYYFDRLCARFNRIGL